MGGHLLVSALLSVAPINDQRDSLSFQHIVSGALEESDLELSNRKEESLVNRKEESLVDIQKRYSEYE